MLKAFLHCCIDNVLLTIAPELNQPLFQFNAVDVCMVSTFLHSCPHGIIYTPYWGWYTPLLMLTHTHKLCSSIGVCVLF